MVETDKKDDQYGLVEELAPTLHQERAGDFTTAMETVIFRRDLARTDGILHPGSGRHGIFATHADTVNEE